MERALQEALQVFNTEAPIQVELESIQDKIREAASVLSYFDMHEKFKTEVCRSCGLEFAFSYYLTAVKCCSIPCMDASLKKIGLSWNPDAPLERRWGRYVPAIVPPVPQAIIKEQLPKSAQEADDLLEFIRNI